MKITPRPYQSAQHDSVIKEFETVGSTLVVSPVGSGKTILFSMLINTFQPKRAIVVAERNELIWQARDKIEKTTGLQCGIEMADLYVNNSLFGETPVVISTIQTQCSAFGDRRRMSRFNPKDFGLLVVDEAHHSTARSYRDLINYYQTNNPDIKVVGVTATPDRADEQALGQIFETVAYDYEILDAINDGWLCDVSQHFFPIIGLDFSHVRTTAGDLNGADLAAVMETEKSIQGVVQPTLEVAFGLEPHSLFGIDPSLWSEFIDKNATCRKRCLCFTVSVKQAENLSNIFNRVRAGMSDWVCGATNKDVRRNMLERFQKSEIQIVVNVNCLGEGFDDPGVDIVVHAAPTKSRSRYAQRCGRAMRPLPGVVDGPETPELRKAAIAASAKPMAIIIDFVGNSGKHKLVTSADILGGKVSDEAIERAIIKAKKKGTAVRMSDALDEEEQLMRKEADARRLAEEARKSRLVASVRYSSKAIDPFDLFQISPVKERGWDDGRTLSSKQAALLLKQGVNPDKLSYSQGRQILNTIFDRWNKKLATLGQLKVLKRYGYDGTKMNFLDASKLIEAIAGNGWKKPQETTK